MVRQKSKVCAFSALTQTGFADDANAYVANKSLAGITDEDGGEVFLWQTRRDRKPMD